MEGVLAAEIIHSSKQNKHLLPLCVRTVYLVNKIDMIFPLIEITVLKKKK